MNKKPFLCLSLLIVVLCGCQKIREYYNPNPGAEVPNCRVVAIIDNNIYPDESSEESIHTVQYNAAGYPEVINEIYRFTAQNGFQKFYDDANVHLYDSENRLIQEGIDRYSAQNPLLKRYVYEGSSRNPVRDTVYKLDSVFVEEFEYDNQERITRILRKHIATGNENSPLRPDEDLRYYYDLRGNRQESPFNEGYTGLIKYSDKPSLYSLHRVWQLKYRDYSRNSTLTVETYTEEGLPEKFADSSDTYFQPFLNAQPGATVQYTCE
jgi:hypothetical protein